MNSEFAAHISFDQTKYVCVCVSCSDEFDYIALSSFDLLKKLRCQLHSRFDKNFRLFADEHSLSFFFKSKKMSSVGVLMEKKKLSVFVRKKI